MRTETTVALSTGVTLCYTRSGPVGEESVVCLPGPTDSWRSYEPVLDRWPRAVSIVAVSLRGHRGSSKPPSGYSVEHLAADVVPFLDSIGVDRAVLAGHSGSCLVARRVALDTPDRVAGLILEASPTTLEGDPGLTGFVDEVVTGLTDPIDRSFAAAFVTDTSTGALEPDLLEALVDDVVAVPTSVWRELFASLLVYDDTDELARLSIPVELVWGDADSLVSRAMQDGLLGALPNANLTVYPGVGHTPRWERAERFASEVAAFAASVLTISR